MTYQVFIQTHDYMTIGDEETEDIYHLFDQASEAILADAGIVIYYGDKLDPAYVYFIPYDQIKSCEMKRE